MISLAGPSSRSQTNGSLSHPNDSCACRPASSVPQALICEIVALWVQLRLNESHAIASSTVKSTRPTTRLTPLTVSMTS